MKSKPSRFIFLALVGMCIGAVLGVGLFFFRGPNPAQTTSQILESSPVQTSNPVQASNSVPASDPVQASDPEQTSIPVQADNPPVVIPENTNASLVKSEPGAEMEVSDAGVTDDEDTAEPDVSNEEAAPEEGVDANEVVTAGTDSSDGMTVVDPRVPEGPDPQPQMVDEKYRYIGLVAPRSGSLSSKGDSMLRGAELAIKHFNAGLSDDQRPFRLLVEDEIQQFSPRNRLVNDPRVGIVVGYVTERSLGESRPVYLKAGKPVLLPILSGADIPMLGDSMFFQMMPSDEDQARFLADYTEHHLKASSVMVIHEDSNFGLMLSQSFTRVLGGEYNREVKDIVYPDNSDDLTDFAAGIAAASPNVVFLALHAREALGVVHALNKAQFKTTYLGTHALAFDYAISILNRMAEKVLITLPFSHETDDKITRTVLKEYETQYQRTMNWLGALTYDAVLLAMQAVSQGGDRIPEIISYLTQTDGRTRTFQGIAGRYSFDEYGRGKGPIYLVEVKPDLLGRVP